MAKTKKKSANQLRVDETVPIEEVEETPSEELTDGLFADLMIERKGNRKHMLSHVLILTYLSFSLLAAIVATQAGVRIFSQYKEFTVLDNQQLNIFAVSVFGQMIGVIIVIVKSLWNDEKYLQKL